MLTEHLLHAGYFARFCELNYKLGDIRLQEIYGLRERGINRKTRSIMSHRCHYRNIYVAIIKMMATIYYIFTI